MIAKWAIAALLTVISIYLTYRLVAGDRTIFVPGPTTHGHYQIALGCDRCHSPFKSVSNSACLRCHQVELTLANDSHAPSKFSDPRNAASLHVLDATRCITCHEEHRPELTRTGDVTRPADLCFACHADIASERPSHARFERNSCAASGCHNYHDNTALYENYVAKYLDEPDVLEHPVLPTRNSAEIRSGMAKPKATPIAMSEQDAPPSLSANPSLLEEWQTTAHAKAGINCSDCHRLAQSLNGSAAWIERPNHQICSQCHQSEVDGFVAGHHGMRLGQGLTPMAPALARLPMRSDASHQHVGCTSCHGAHRFDTGHAAVEGCLGCHNDRHSLAYKRSAHYRLWQDELTGSGTAGTGVTCATCHLPREHGDASNLTTVFVQHNQNSNLRPNSRMMRYVCQKCHGLELSLDALASSALLENNFQGPPSRVLQTARMVKERHETSQKQTKKPLNEEQ